MKRTTAFMSVLLLAACGSPTPTAAPTTAPASTAPASTVCAAGVRTDPLPEWARAGFSGDSHPPYVLGARGDIAAILFGYPLAAPPRPDRSNKILWVSRLPLQPGSPLKIKARMAGAGEPVLREVQPGPSIVDLPAAGCWHLYLSWSEHTDEIDLGYMAH
ncbi:hypothetical protein [Phytohabitans rumicis]|uniref:Lipoprotein n=1 Tax=Phytohabitans rumicis TaxID=1076125 RepID=A0A6V8KWM5_9ACTN|nr:hypothetical protein [Phytohabitans rumicis]GFJ88254.1 hypothetical protein Prum_018960 [Phytohabitans rumicis]